MGRRSDLKRGWVKGVGRKGTEVGRTRGSGLSVRVRTISPVRQVYKLNEISELSSYYIAGQYLY